MSHNNIFWLEDNPSIFFRLLGTFLNMNPDFDLDTLLSRTTIAFDFEMGVELIKKGGYDLHILDADFADRLNDRLRGANQLYVNNLKSNKFGPLRHSGELHDLQITNNFVNFYDKFLDAMPNVIVYSASRIATMAAFALEIPFYSKVTEKRDILHNLGIFGNVIYLPFSSPGSVKEVFLRRNLNGKVIEEEILNKWEYGGKEELVEKYLI